MKKPTLKIKKWHAHRAKNQSRRVGREYTGWGFPGLESPTKRRLVPVQIWQGGDPEWAFCLSPPTSPPDPLCLRENRNETFRIFAEMRRNLNRSLDQGTTFVHRPEKVGSWPRVPSYFDLSGVSDVSTAAAVIMAAEYERIRVLQSEVPPTVELDKWNDIVFTKLYQLGFFEITGHTPGNDDKLTLNDESLTMRIVRSTSSDDLHAIDLALQKLFAFLGADDSDPIIIEFLTALSEAMTNVTNHAYMPGVHFDYQHIDSFWVAATAHQKDRSISIVVYDQGATIPETYPRLSRVQKVGRFLARALTVEKEHDCEHDGTFIRAAMRYGGSRTDQSHRGRGLPQMFKTLQKIGKGTLAVYSRGGWCMRTSEGRMKSGYVDHKLGGTLVEWTVAVP